MNWQTILFAIYLTSHVSLTQGHELSLRLNGTDPGLQAIDRIILILASRADEKEFRPSGGLRTEQIRRLKLKWTWEI